MVVHINHIVKLNLELKNTVLHANYKILLHTILLHTMFAYLSLKILFSVFFMEYHCQPQ